MTIECPDCGGKVSTEAASCPHCGYPVKDTNNRIRTSNDSPITRQRNCGDIVLYGGLAVIVLLFWLLRGC